MQAKEERIDESGVLRKWTGSFVGNQPKKIDFYPFSCTETEDNREDGTNAKRYVVLVLGRGWSLPLKPPSTPTSFYELCSNPSVRAKGRRMRKRSGKAE